MNPIDDSSNHRAKILIVDDTPANLRLLSRMLTEQGYAVRAANSGEAALQFMEATAPDIVLLDVKMPDLDGYEVCHRMKASERLRDVPVIFLSAMDAAWDKVKAFSAGGIDYIVKPIEETEMLARLETHLQLRSLRRDLEHQVRERTMELLKAKQAVYEKQQLLKSIIDSSGTIITVKDTDGCYMLVNKRFQELFGEPGGDPRGLTDHEIFPADVAELLRALDRQVINTGQAEEAEVVLPLRSGERRTYISVKSPLHDLNGHIHAVCGISTDITERVREEETLRELNELLENRLAQRLIGDDVFNTLVPPPLDARERG